MEFNKLIIGIPEKHNFKLNKPNILKNEISKYIEKSIYLRPYSFDFSVELFDKPIKGEIGLIKVNNIIY